MVHAVNTESEGGELLGAKLLEGAHPFARGFQFHESNMAAGEEDQPVRHPIKSGGHEFGRQPPTLFCLGDELALNRCFSQNGLLFPCFVLTPVFPLRVYRRIACSNFYIHYQQIL